jgi:hypothetical protein
MIHGRAHVAAVVLTLCFAPSVARAQESPASGTAVTAAAPLVRGLELFSRTGFGGDRRTLTGAEPNLRDVGFNDFAQSLRIGARETWQVCMDAGFRRCLLVTGDVRDLKDLGLSGRISSVRPWRQDAGHIPDPGSPDPRNRVAAVRPPTTPQ